MTTADLLAIPEDGIERELIQGRLKEREMTRRNRLHAATEATIAKLLGIWLDTNAAPKAAVLPGEVGTILASAPDTTVGIEAAVFPISMLEDQSSETSLVQGAPLLAVEFPSPSDKHEDVHQKIEEYLRCGVSLVWEVDPDFKTLRVHRRDHEPVMFNREQELPGFDALPDFTVSVAELFPSWS
ncbi:MAG: Uma2 family endonuclease [Pirellulaceae bacterium]